MDTSTRPPVKHLGKKIGRIREMLGMKQETLAEKMGTSQQSVSKMEQNESIDETTLDRVAKALGVNSEAIKNFSEETAYNFINNFNDSSTNHGSLNNYNCTFNPLDEVKKLNAEKEELYKALLKEKEEKIALLERMLEKKK